MSGLAASYQPVAQCPSQAKTGGSNTSVYPLLTDRMKTNVKNKKQGAIQTHVNRFIAWSSGGSGLRANRAAPAAPVPSASMPKRRQKRAIDMVIGAVKTLSFDGTIFQRIENE